MNRQRIVRRAARGAMVLAAAFIIGQLLDWGGLVWWASIALAAGGIVLAQTVVWQSRTIDIQSQMMDSIREGERYRG